jgi:hypothetical protein
MEDRDQTKEEARNNVHVWCGCLVSLLNPFRQPLVRSKLTKACSLTIISTVRIPYVSKFAKSMNSTGMSHFEYSLLETIILRYDTADTVETVVWSSIEVSVGMMVACMPGARQFVRDIISRGRRDRSSELQSKTSIFIDRSLATIIMTRQQPTIESDDSFSSSIVKTDMGVEASR